MNRSPAIPDMMKSGVQSGAQKGLFKSANDLGHAMNIGGSAQGVAGIERKAETMAIKHSTKGLMSRRPSVAKVKPITNLAKSIGRKRGF